MMPAERYEGPIDKDFIGAGDVNDSAGDDDDNGDMVIGDNQIKLLHKADPRRTLLVRHDTPWLY